jgi:hypothetical protein
MGNRFWIKIQGCNLESGSVNLLWLLWLVFLESKLCCHQCWAVALEFWMGSLFFPRACAWLERFCIKLRMQPTTCSWSESFCTNLKPNPEKRLVMNFSTLTVGRYITSLPKLTRTFQSFQDLIKILFCWELISNWIKVNAIFRSHDHSSDYLKICLEIWLKYSW